MGFQKYVQCYKSHDALLLVGFQKCVQCLKNNSRCFTVSGISEVCSMLKKKSRCFAVNGISEVCSMFKELFTMLCWDFATYRIRPRPMGGSI